MTHIDPLRNATLTDLAGVLQSQQAAKLDIVAPATTLRAEAGRLILGHPGQLYPHPTLGMIEGGIALVPTEVCDEGIAAKLGIPLTYLRKLRTEHTPLYDANVNGWLERDGRSFLVRAFVDPAEGSGIARALLSDKYKTMDNLDALAAVLDGARQARTTIEVEACDLTERRMYLRFVAPEVSIYAPELLENYRSPFSGRSGRDLPLISAGLVATNSETGGGAWTIAPRMVVQVCTNGMTRMVDAIRAVHLGSKLDEGLVDWSTDTHHKAMELITAKARDAVSTFLNVEYMARVVEEMKATANTGIERPEATLKVVAAKLSYDQGSFDGILAHFIKGGEMTAGGVFHAVTSYAQSVTNPDAAFDLEASAWRAMELAAA